MVKLLGAIIILSLKLTGVIHALSINLLIGTIFAILFKGYI